MPALFDHLLKRLLRQAFPAPLPQPAAEPAAECVADAEDPPRGCGWFDSSHELQAGLQVMEHASAETAALPLGDWLALHLGSWQAQPGQGCAV